MGNLECACIHRDGKEFLFPKKSDKDLKYLMLERYIGSLDNNNDSVTEMAYATDDY